MITLAEFQPGETGQILGFKQGNKAYRQKLLAMGLTPGTQFQVLRVAPLGDPVLLNIRGYALSLRKQEAAVLKLEKVAL